MNIMNKFEKRLKKISKNIENCLVVGQGFGHLEELTEIYNTVFVIDKTRPELKVKNLVFRDNFDDTSYMPGISSVFFDLNSISELEKSSPVWLKNKSLVIIEGDSPIERHLSTPLYRAGWQCTSVQGFFHVWEPKK